MARRRAGRQGPAVLALVRQLGEALEEFGLQEIEVGWGGVRVRLQRPGAVAPALAAPLAPAPAEKAAAPVVADVVPPSMLTVDAPMVGTFYRAPSPTADPYVREGDLVKEGQILCIIEAMKLMNEIESRAAGRVVKVFVENGHAVEYGQPLFLIDPAR